MNPNEKSPTKDAMARNSFACYQLRCIPSVEIDRIKFLKAGVPEGIAKGQQALTRMQVMRMTATCFATSLERNRAMAGSTPDVDS